MKTWTANELNLLQALTLQVVLLSVDQAARAWFRGGRPAADHALQRLAAAGLVALYRVNLPPLPPGREPVVCWRPGEPFPCCDALAEHLRRRWGRAAEPVEVATPTRLAVNLFGSAHPGGLPRLEQRGHDHTLAERFVRYRQLGLADRWVGEHALAKRTDIRGLKHPDAYLLDERGRRVRVIESAGAYAADHLRQLHAHCLRRRLELELL